MSVETSTRKRATTPALFGLIVLTVLVIGLFLTLGIKGRWEFVLQLRATKLATLLVVGCATAISTVAFQTIANNRILTPSIMGFDALYMLIQTLLVFVAGSGVFGGVDPRLLFMSQVAVMVAFAILLYRWLFVGSLRSLHLLLLTGVVLGILFRSLSSVMQRMIDPNDFVVLQDRFFASFNKVDTTLLGIVALVSLFAAGAIWTMRRELDVLALGRDPAIALGIDYKGRVTRLLVLIAILVSASTALVGPVAFFGLLVANLSYSLARSHRHAELLPVAALLAILFLVGGQMILERGFAFNTALAIVVEFIGGAFFIVLLMRGGVR